MHFRCPACSTVHPLNAAVLAQGGGQVRCGKCNATVNALDSLFDDWPGPGEKPVARGELPVLGQAIDLQAGQRARLAPDGEPTDEAPVARAPSRARRWLLRAAWLVGGLAIGAVVIFKAAEFAGQPLVEPGEIDTALQKMGLAEAGPEPVFRNIELIHLVSRRLAVDPDQPGVLRLQATIVNRASKSQPYPDLEVILFDAVGARIADYSFAPRDYLAAHQPEDADMAPHAYLPLSLELDDPGVQAVGFELNFH
jgi:predicted Zn finger-like uncharacterized protein